MASDRGAAYLPHVMFRLRRQRWLAAALLLASPGAAGVVLPVLDPCPVQNPWLASDGGSPMSRSMPAMTHTVSQGLPHCPGHGRTCCCIGCSAAPSIAAEPEPIVIATGHIAPVRSRWPVIEARGNAPASIDLLPPKTAPPA